MGLVGGEISTTILAFILDYSRKTNDKMFQKIKKGIFKSKKKFLTHKTNMQVFKWPFTKKQLI